MKPHLRKDKGVWVCAGFACVWEVPEWQLRAYDFFMGHGYTVRQACADWQEQTRAARSAAQL